MAQIYSKYILRLLGVLSLIILVLTIYILKDSFLEKWYIKKLRSENLDEVKLASEKLSEMGSFHVILENCAKEFENFYAELKNPSKGGSIDFSKEDAIIS